MTGTQPHHSPSTQALAGPPPSVSISSSNPATTPTTHPTTHITEATTQPVAGKTTPPAARPSPDGPGPTGPQLVTVPDMMGYTETYAVHVLEADGFHVEIETTGPQGPVNGVLKQSPVGQAPRGTTVIIVVGDPFPF